MLLVLVQSGPRFVISSRSGSGPVPGFEFFAGLGPVRDFKFCWSELVLDLGNVSVLRSQNFTLGLTGFGPWILGHDVILEMKRMN